MIFGSFGFVEYLDEESAERAFNEMDNTTL